MRLLRLRRGNPGPGAGLMLALAVLLIVNPSCEAPSGPGSDGESPIEQEQVEARVVDVTDGDTVEVRLEDGGGRIEDVRYIGVDTPETVAGGEPVQCFGPAASAFNRTLVGGRRVTLVLGEEQRDRYGRLLAYVYLQGRFVNALLLRRGYARALTIAPNDTFASRFRQLEAAAARAGRGLWSACGP